MQVAGEMGLPLASRQASHSSRNCASTCLVCFMAARPLPLLTCLVGPDRSRRVPSNRLDDQRMIKQGSLLGRASPTTASEELYRACSSSLLVLDDHWGRG